MKAERLCASRVMRVLSPRMEPPERVEVGSIASTATLCPSSTRFMPSWSIAVDLPTPGVPVMPMRCARPAWGSRRCSRCWARS